MRRFFAVATVLFFAGIFSQASGLSLGEAVAEALQNSPEVRQAVIELKKAALEEPALLALTDPVFGVKAFTTNDQGPRSVPVIQGAFSKSHDLEASLSQNLLIGTEAQIFFRTQKLDNPALFRPLNPTASASLGFEIRQPLLRYFWGRPDKAKRRQAASMVDAAAGALRRVNEAEAIRAMLAYVQTYIAQKNIAIREAALADARQLVHNYQEKRGYGLIEASDLLQAEVSARAQETELRLAFSRLKQAEEALRRALYRRDSQAFAESLQLPQLLNRPLPQLQEALKLATANRGDYLESAHRVASAESFVRVEKLNTLPDLSVFGSYAWGGLDARFSPAFRQARLGDFPIYTTGIQIELPLAWKKESLRRERATLALETARAQRERIETQVRHEISDALESLDLAQDRAAAYEELFALEKQKLDAAQEDFKRGRSSTDLLIRFQADIYRTESLLIDAKADILAHWAKLALATGALLESFVEITGEALP